ncbi:MAG: hypothetical protein BWY52_01872 [Chloroflexi bacterium ADurb.Bin325]|nr:MAG: hypothetical protein BWY52_01872 [Chloroflexi bacterium ADurb.Bin325]
MTGGGGVPVMVGVAVGGPGVSVGGGGAVGGPGVSVGGGGGVAVTMTTTTVCTPEAPSGGTGTKIGPCSPDTTTCGVGSSSVGSTTPGKRVRSNVGVATCRPPCRVQVGRGVRVGVAAEDVRRTTNCEAEQANEPSAIRNRAPKSTAKVRWRIASIPLVRLAPPRAGVCPASPARPKAGQDHPRVDA